MDRIKGRVIWFKGTMGFLCPDGKEEGEADVFLHYSQIVMKNATSYKKLDANDKVSFLIGHNHKGPMAIEVIKEESPAGV